MSRAAPVTVAGLGLLALSGVVYSLLDGAEATEGHWILSAVGIALLLIAAAFPKLGALRSVIQHGKRKDTK